MKKMMLGLSAISFLLCCNDSYGRDQYRSRDTRLRLSDKTKGEIAKNRLKNSQGQSRVRRAHQLTQPGDRPTSENHYKNEIRERRARGDATADVTEKIEEDTAVAGSSIPAGKGDADIQATPVEGNAAADAPAAAISDAPNSDPEMNVADQGEISNGGEIEQATANAEAGKPAAENNPQENEKGTANVENATADAKAEEPTAAAPQTGNGTAEPGETVPADAHPQENDQGTADVENATADAKAEEPIAEGNPQIDNDELNSDAEDLSDRAGDFDNKSAALSIEKKIRLTMDSSIPHIETRVPLIVSSMNDLQKQIDVLENSIRQLKSDLEKPKELGLPVIGLFRITKNVSIPHIETRIPLILSSMDDLQNQINALDNFKEGSESLDDKGKDECLKKLEEKSKELRKSIGIHPSYRDVEKIRNALLTARGLLENAIKSDTLKSLTDKKEECFKQLEDLKKTIEDYPSASDIKEMHDKISSVYESLENACKLSEKATDSETLQSRLTEKVTSIRKAISPLKKEAKVEVKKAPLNLDAIADFNEKLDKFIKEIDKVLKAKRRSPNKIAPSGATCFENYNEIQKLFDKELDIPAELVAKVAKVRNDLKEAYDEYIALISLIEKNSQSDQAKSLITTQTLNQEDFRGKAANSMHAASSLKLNISSILRKMGYQKPKSAGASIASTVTAGAESADSQKVMEEAPGAAISDGLVEEVSDQQRSAKAKKAEFAPSAPVDASPAA